MAIFISASRVEMRDLRALLGLTTHGRLESDLRLTRKPTEDVHARMK